MSAFDNNIVSPLVEVEKFGLRSNIQLNERNLFK